MKYIPLLLLTMLISSGYSQTKNREIIVRLNHKLLDFESIDNLETNTFDFKDV